MKISEANNLRKEDFLKAFANIVECYPQFASELYCYTPFLNVQQFISFSENLLEELPLEEKEKILTLHPDLAGKLAKQGKLTAESDREQRAAGLVKLTRDKRTQLNDLNQRYKKKFGFPFVICARENKFETILSGLRFRLGNEKEQEIKTGIDEVKKICRFRIQDIVTDI